MTDFPCLKPYGFTYEHNGKEFAFHVLAASREEAEARVHDMQHATSLGRLHSDATNQSDGDTLRVVQPGVESAYWVREV